MKQRLTPLAISLCLLGMASAPAFAADSNQDVDQLAKQVSALQKQVDSLQSTLKHNAKHGNKTSATQAAAPSTDATSEDYISNTTTYFPMDIDVPGQSFVSSGPYIGIPLQYAGGNLIINSPSVNQDVTLLQVRKGIHHRLDALGVTEAQDHAHVLLSGIVEGQAIYKDIGRGPNSSDIDITSAGLDAYILGPSDWLSSLISLNYDNNIGTQGGSLSNNSRALNSHVFVNQAFVTIGNFSVTPIYSTFGQIYVPFGTYSSNMVSASLTRSIFRTKARAIVLGYSPQVDDTFYASVFAFKGDTYVGATSRVNNGGVNLGYRFVEGKFTGDIGGGAIANIADATGMQDVSNSNSTFNGFGGATFLVPTGTGTVNSVDTGDEQITHRVPAYDIRALFGIGDHIDLLAEYITASTNFSKNDLTMNNHGAKPQAFNGEAAYTFQAFDRPTSVAVGYGMTKDAMALQVPAQRYSLVFNTSIWRDTLQSLEFRHDVNYGLSNSASGSMLAAPMASGEPDNAITAQFDVYF